MKAAVVSSFAMAPVYDDVADPIAPAGHEIVDVLAAGLHPRVRSQAAGSHYTSTDELPLIPGIDGVGRRADGALTYFVLPDTRFGAMAERVAVDPRRAVEVPVGSDPVVLAAAMNPAMSSWIALRRRIDFAPGQKVLVLGATGNAGRMAVQVARHLGAAEVIAAGRDARRLASLAALGADRVVQLSPDEVGTARELAAAGRDVDVVLDYLWGDPAAEALRAIVPARKNDDQQLTWVQIGSVAGPECAVPSAALRATRLRLVGSGQGSVATRAIVEELPALAAQITAGAFDVDAVAVPLAEVQAVWGHSDAAGGRVVLVP